MVFSCLVGSRLSAETAWNQISTPVQGEPFSQDGGGVKAATLDSNTMRAFVATYKKGDMKAAFELGRRVIKVNSVIPTNVVADLRGILKTEDQGPVAAATDSGANVMVRISFPGVGDFRMRVNWEKNVIGDFWTSHFSNTNAIDGYVGESIALPAALGYLKNFLELRGIRSSQLSMTARNYGSGKSILFSVFSKSRMPEIGSKYLMDCSFVGAPIREMDDQAVMRAVGREISPITKEKHLELAKSFLALRAPGSILVENAKDIPGIDLHPPDADLVRAIGPVLSVTEVVTNREPALAKREVLVLYAYTRLGGLLTRYRFTFDAWGNDVFTSVVGRRVGDFAMLE